MESDRGRFSAAGNLLAEASRINAVNFGATDVRTLLAQVALARVYQATGQRTAAERIYRQALPLLANSNAAKDNRVQQALGDYQKLVASTGGKRQGTIVN